MNPTFAGAVLFAYVFTAIAPVAALGDGPCITKSLDQLLGKAKVEGIQVGFNDQMRLLRRKLLSSRESVTEEIGSANVRMAITHGGELQATERGMAHRFVIGCDLPGQPDPHLVILLVPPTANGAPNIRVAENIQAAVGRLPRSRIKDLDAIVVNSISRGDFDPAFGDVAGDASSLRLAHFGETELVRTGIVNL